MTFHVYLVEYRNDYKNGSWGYGNDEGKIKATPTIYLYGRDDEGTKSVKQIKGFYPYFYIEKGKEIPSILSPYIYKMEDDGYRNLMGEDVIKVYTYNPGNVKFMRDAFDTYGIKTFEDDIVFVLRFLIDEKDNLAKNGIDLKFDWRRLYLDIETTMQYEGINAKTAKESITCIGCYDSYDKIYRCFIWHPDFNKIRDIKVEGVVIIPYPNEEMMLRGWLDFYKDKNPDMLLGWNCVSADTYILLESVIKQLKDTREGDETNIYGKIKKKKYSGKKICYEISDWLGNTINVTDEHIIPVVYKEKNSYKNYDSLIKEVRDKKVGDIRRESRGKDIFLLSELKENKNKNFKNLPEDLFWLLGIIYTDGTYNPKERIVSICNKDKNLIKRVDGISKKYGLKVNKWKKYEWKVHWDKCYYYDLYLRKDNKLSNLLFSFIYNKSGKKELDIENLSHLSFSQFTHFFSGLVDGDGSVDKDYGIVSLSNTKKEDMKKLQTLLFYNNVLSSYTSHSDTLSIIKRERNNHFLTLLKKQIVIRYKKDNLVIPKNGKCYDDKRKSLKLMCSGNNYLIKVKSIKEIGEKECYDIETEKHYFNANGIKVHNCAEFDISYIANRLDVLRLGKDKLCTNGSRRGVWFWESEDGSWLKPNISGTVIFDLLKYYKKINLNQIPSYSLDNVSQEELGEGKEEIVNADKCWRETPEKLIKYNRKDIELSMRIAEKRELVEFVDGMRQMIGCNFDDFHYFSRLVDILVLSYAKRHSIILPSKRKVAGPYIPKDEREAGFEGAFVYALPGLYNNVCALDLKTLYPLIIKSMNISFETLCDDGDIKIGECSYTTKKIGILPAVIDDLLQVSLDYKSKRDKAKAGSDDYKKYANLYECAKFVVCTLYGVQATPSFRLFDIRNASSITMVGREIIQFTKKLMEDEGHTVVVVDTDSSYVVLNEKFKEKDECIAEGKRLVSLLNEKYNEFATAKGASNHYFQIKFEKFYDKLIVGKKKRYAGHMIWKEGYDQDYITITGFEFVRSSSSKRTKFIQRDILEMILQGKDYEEVKSYIVSECRKIYSGHYKPSEIAFPSAINKSEYENDLPRIRGMLWSNNHIGTKFKSGDKPLMLYVKDEKKETDSVLFEYDSEFAKAEEMGISIDKIKMIERVVFMPLATIFESMNWDLEKIEEEVKLAFKGQTTISKWQDN